MSDGRLLGRVAGLEAFGSMFVLRIDVPGWRPAAPGQFALLQPQTSAVFLPRAFSLHGQSGESLAFLISPVGAGTEELGRSVEGDSVWVLGPVGRGFDLGRLAARAGRLVIVGGGVGIAPFPLLIQALVDASAHRSADAPGERDILVLLGFRDSVQAGGADSFTSAAEAARAAGFSLRVELITEDGSLGRCGLVTDLLAEELSGHDVVVACGAHAMCAAVWEICSACGCDSWFSLEAGMACGVGSCQGCVIALADGSLARVCREGPVFSGETAFGPRAHVCTGQTV